MENLSTEQLQEYMETLNDLKENGFPMLEAADQLVIEHNIDQELAKEVLVHWTSTQVSETSEVSETSDAPQDSTQATTSETTNSEPELLVLKPKRSSYQKKVYEWFDTVCPDGTPAERSKAIDALDINEYYRLTIELNPNWSQKGNEKGIRVHWSWYRSNYKKTHGLPRRTMNVVHI